MCLIIALIDYLILSCYNDTREITMKNPNDEAWPPPQTAIQTEQAPEGAFQLEIEFSSVSFCPSIKPGKIEYDSGTRIIVPDPNSLRRILLRMTLPDYS